uniref:Transmembrane protein n=1 Tax=Cacopsylla melanoneura TaxID=428564 RepID=A0A8D8Y2L7_9HEMI
MILHLCHHWFWITTIGVLLTMPVIVKGWEVQADPHPDLGSTNASHPTTVRTKFKAVLLNMTRLYPVPSDSVPDNTSSLTETTDSSSRRIPVGSSAMHDLGPIGRVIPASAESSGGLTEEQEEVRVEHIDRTLFAIEPSVETRQLIASPEPTIPHPARGEQPSPINPSHALPDNSSDTREQPTEVGTRDLTTLGDNRELPTLGDTRELPTLSDTRELPTLGDTRDLTTLGLEVAGSFSKQGQTCQAGRQHPNPKKQNH